MSRVILGMLLSLLMVNTAAAQGDPFDGTWKLNLAKSTFNVGPPPKSELVRVRVTAGEEYLWAEIVNADGSRSVTEYTAKFDGKQYPMVDAETGKPTGVSVVLKRTDPWHEERHGFRDGKKTGTNRREVSKDGTVFTSTIMDAEGKVLSIRVFDKQPAG